MILIFHNPIHPTILRSTKYVTMCLVPPPRDIIPRLLLTSELKRGHILSLVLCTFLIGRMFDGLLLTLGWQATGRRRNRRCQQHLAMPLAWDMTRTKLSDNHKEGTTRFPLEFRAHRVSYSKLKKAHGTMAVIFSQCMRYLITEGVLTALVLHSYDCLTNNTIDPSLSGSSDSNSSGYLSRSTPPFYPQEHAENISSECHGGSVVSDYDTDTFRKRVYAADDTALVDFSYGSKDLGIREEWRTDDSANSGKNDQQTKSLPGSLWPADVCSVDVDFSFHAVRGETVH